MLVMTNRQQNYLI